MEYNSFYGGRRGASFIIAKSFTSIAQMVAAFQQGGAYKTVNYDEYVIIDTPNKNNADNGKIYRRGYDYNNELGGAIYEGQIVGPAGVAPYLEMKTISEVEQLVIQEGASARRGSGSYGRTQNLVPGKYVESGSGTIGYNDEIEWVYCSVRSVDGSDSTSYIGFKFPYPVIDFTISSENSLGIVSIERIDDETHPFYEKWHINLPVPTTSAIVGRENDSAVAAIARDLPEHSAWLIIEDQ